MVESKKTAEEQFSAEKVREMKQPYLIENVQSKGFDTTEFAQFLAYQKGK